MRNLFVRHATKENTPLAAMSSHHDTRTKPNRRSTTGMPRWVKVMVIIFFVLILLLVILHLTGNGFGSHMHMPTLEHGVPLL